MYDMTYGVGTGKFLTNQVSVNSAYCFHSTIVTVQDEGVNKAYSAIVL